ncbi:hypothetical protein L202_07430 [Cryptococcus amylolentus CBS 6039]|uniref:Uncharacterized protein n=1 Tax=Cryptococcus amylolentus CBS 6039 TaxID=1295533 RepID=A0A1E3HC74_9TREE|nr:hypothetical protein L202_07430 [Cryptococcus amylolentus CBS 6039]ODN73924.1 hypothetical protein L202_07430 [Cryptococcus amylolentus CBS 6039]
MLLQSPPPSIFINIFPSFFSNVFPPIFINVHSSDIVLYQPSRPPRLIDHRCDPSYNGVRRYFYVLKRLISFSGSSGPRSCWGNASAVIAGSSSLGTCRNGAAGLSRSEALYSASTGSSLQKEKRKGTKYFCILALRLMFRWDSAADSREWEEAARQYNNPNLELNPHHYITHYGQPPGDGPRHGSYLREKCRKIEGTLRRKMAEAVATGRTLSHFWAMQIKWIAPVNSSRKRITATGCPAKDNICRRLLLRTRLIPYPTGPPVGKDNNPYLDKVAPERKVKKTERRMNGYRVKVMLNEVVERERNMTESERQGMENLERLYHENRVRFAALAWNEELQDFILDKRRLGSKKGRGVV